MKLFKFAALFFSVIAATVAFAPPAHAADMDFGVRAGVDVDGSDPFVGVELLMPMSHRLFFNPNVERYFRDNDRDLTSLNADMHYDFNVGHDKYAWAGAGLALQLRDKRQAGEDRTSVGVNVLGGLGIQAGTITPYVQAKAVLADDDQVVIGVGVRF